MPTLIESVWKVSSPFMSSAISADLKEAQEATQNANTGRIPLPVDLLDPILSKEEASIPYSGQLPLRVLAVAAPELPEGPLGEKVLKSDDPASMFNACRYAAFLAENSTGAWRESNWAVSRKERRETMLLMHSWKQDSAVYKQLLERIQPNLLLIGAMTLCLPGAVACAKVAKELLGDQVCVVLGGRHTAETIFQNPQGLISHHPGSPLRLMLEGAIENVFDLVVAGEGEHLVSYLGKQIWHLEKNKIAPAKLPEHLKSDVQNIPGRWIIGKIEGNEIKTAQGTTDFDRNLLPSPAEMFGIRSSFDVFKGRLTAHAFSDTGSGCAYDCGFCSERRSVSGPIMQLDTSADRLFQQLSAAVKVVKVDSPAFKASAFIEDSTLLAGSNYELRKLTNLLSVANLDLRFGAQFTIDQILSRQNLLQELKAVGLDYLFIGIETPEPSAIGGMSKDVGKDSWLKRTENVLETLSSLGIQCGAALLFGMGESHDSRIALFHQIEKWRSTYKNPDPISLNWAVQHPLKGLDGGTAYRYVEWGTPPVQEWLAAFQNFGEASVLYPLAGQKPPVLSEAQELASIFGQLH